MIVTLFGRDKTGITLNELDSVDRMNKDTAHKLENQRISDCLLQLSNENTHLLRCYLKMMRFQFTLFNSANMLVEERFYKIAYAVAFLRIWKRAGGSFITMNAYQCVEINFHSIIGLYRNLRDKQQLEYFIPELNHSQTCEKEFRRIRSLTTTESTVVNFSSKGATKRLQRIESLRHSEHYLANNGKLWPITRRGQTSAACHRCFGNLPLVAALPF